MLVDGQIILVNGLIILGDGLNFNWRTKSLHMKRTLANERHETYFQWHLMVPHVSL